VRFPAELCPNYAGSGSNSDLNQRQLRRFPSSVFSILQAGLVWLRERILTYNPKVGGSNPPPATNGIIKLGEPKFRLPF
jgi:hypothetical protein